MRYVLALLFPPLGPFFCGRLGACLVNVLLCVVVVAFGLLTGGVGFVTGVIPLVHAWAVIHGHNADRRTAKVVAAIHTQRTH